MSPPASPQATFDIDNEGSWPTWQENLDADNLSDKIVTGIASNHFSTWDSIELPIVTAHVASAARQSPEELRKEMLGFVIMSRNTELLEQILRQMFIRDRLDPSTLEIFPFHLAASYLDGSKTCCVVFDTIFRFIRPSRIYVNGLGHTVLDQLMICILKSHTSCSPSAVDETFRHEKRFDGEDIDICGRWDADSDCVRDLATRGKSQIPHDWKHAFCHTSVQAICHSIGTIFWDESGSLPDIDKSSGLFGRRCVQCGLKLQLYPLHTLVLVAAHLSSSSCEGENLFGILACLICLLRYGADVNLRANISIEAILHGTEVDCSLHGEVDVMQFAERVESSLNPNPPKEIRRGWRIINNVLKQARGERNAKELEDEVSSPTSRSGSPEEQEVSYEEFTKVFYSNKHELEPLTKGFEPLTCIHGELEHDHPFAQDGILAPLWAAVQTELLTYRRLKESDPWISPYFDLDLLGEDLQLNRKLTLPLLRNRMMRPFCRCGVFPGSAPACTRREQAAYYHFSNLEDWKRTTFLESMDHRWGRT